MKQDNRDNSKNWQTTNTGGTNYVGEIHFHGTQPKAGIPWQAPPLPRPYIDRPEIRQNVKAQLLTKEEDTPFGTLVISAIYGLGGIGKSVLATALAHDADVQAYFPDGILWATLGQQPDILAFLSGWIQALGDRDYKITTIDSASTHLRTLLHDKRVLIVVDDVWNPDHVEPFRIGSQGCRVLVTTREARIPDAQRYDMDVMSPEEAVQLLLQKAQSTQPSATEQQLAEALALEVGYLPLALELAGAQIAEGVTWAELLEDLRAEVARLETLDLLTGDSSCTEKTRKRLSLVASFNLSLRQLSPEQLRYFAWLGVLPEDVTITQDMAATLWQLTPRQAGPILRKFWAKALLLAGARQSDQKLTYRIHDLMHDLAKRMLTSTPSPTTSEELPGLGLTLPAAHAALLERYQLKTRNQLWHTLPDDGYIHAHLTWHFEQAQQVDALHQFLREETESGHNGWYDACDRLGQTANFVTDITRAWILAEAMYPENPSFAIALQCRYALIMTSLNSLAKNISPELMAALVQEGIWTPVQGLAYAVQIPNLGQRGTAFQQLVPHLPESLLPKVLEAARSLSDGYSRTQVLVALAPYLPEVWSEVLEAARSIPDGYSRYQVLVKLAPHLPELWPEALAAAYSIPHRYRCDQALVELTPLLPKELMSEALAAARSIRDGYSCCQALVKLALHLPKELMSEALAAARSIEDRYYRDQALVELTPLLPKELMSEALAVARSIPDGYSRCQALVKLALHLPELWPEALAAARSIEEEYYRDQALVKLAPHLPELWPEALAAARSIEDGYNRYQALVELAPHLPELWSEALAAARLIEEEYYRYQALVELAPHLPELWSEALAAARSIEEEYYREPALVKLAPLLPEAWSEALAAARSIQNGYSRYQALVELATHLPEAERSQEITHAAKEALLQALEAARTIQDDLDRITILGELAPYLPEFLVLEGLEIAQTIQPLTKRVKVLIQLIPRLPDILPEVLQTARDILDVSERAKALIKIVPHLPNICPETLQTAREIRNDFKRAYALTKLVPCSLQLLPEALEATRKVELVGYITLLSHLIPFQPDLLPEALKAAREIKDAYIRPTILSNLVPYAPEILLEVYEDIKSIPSDVPRAYALGQLVAQCSFDTKTYSFWCEILHTLANRDRQDLLRNLPNLSRAIFSLGGEGAIAGVFEAIQDVGRWWK